MGTHSALTGRTSASQLGSAGVTRSRISTPDVPDRTHLHHTAEGLGAKAWDPRVPRETWGSGDSTGWGVS